MHIKRNDVVIAVRGSQSGTGKTGKVLEVFPDRGRVLVEGMNLIKRHMRKTQDNPKGGIVEKEASISASNLMLHCPHCKKGVRIQRVVEGGRKIRKCRKCKPAFDS